jgi:hypothetical protein
VSFGSGPYAHLGAPADAPLYSSRLLNASGQYITRDDGGFEPMDDVDQRVQLLVAFAAKRSAKLTARDLNTMRDDVIKALEVMSLARPPEIADVVVTAEQAGPSTSRIKVTFTNLSTSAQQTVSVQ